MLSGMQIWGIFIQRQKGKLIFADRLALFLPGFSDYAQRKQLNVDIGLFLGENNVKHKNQTKHAGGRIRLAYMVMDAAAMVKSFSTLKIRRLSDKGLFPAFLPPLPLRTD